MSKRKWNKQRVIEAILDRHRRELSLTGVRFSAPALARAAYLAGHEIMIHFPMEPDEPNEDPGVGALLLDLPDVELRRRLMDGLSRIEGVVGVNNHMGSRFTSDQAAMALVLTSPAFQRQ